MIYPTCLLSRVRLAGLLLPVLILGALDVQALDWTRYQIGEATFQAPSEWNITYRGPENSEYRLKSPDGSYEMQVFWWLPDEPLDGYEDIVSSQNIVVGGQSAKLIHSKFPGHQSLQLVFERARADQKRFILMLESSTVDLAPGSSLHNELLSRLHFAKSSVAAGSMPKIAEESNQKAEGSSDILFSGELGEVWQPYQMDGGDFKKFARLEKGTLLVDVPQGRYWGRTGIFSSRALLKSPVEEKNKFVRIGIEIDPSLTSDAIVSLVPAEVKTSFGEWSKHHVRLGLHSHKDDSSMSLHLWVMGRQMGTTVVSAWPLSKLYLILRPDGVILVSDENKNILLQGTMPASTAKDGYRVYALTGSRFKNIPVKLALRSITVDYPAFEFQQEPDAYLQSRASSVLFESGIMGRLWKPYNAHGGDYAKHSRIDNGMLIVDVPANSRWGRVGLYSEEPLVWLDRFGRGAEVKLAFEFGSAATTGFVIALSPLYNKNGNEPFKPFVKLHWAQKEDGTGAQARLTTEADSPQNPKWEQELPNAAPEKVILGLSPEGVRIEAKGMPNQIYPWQAIEPGQGFRVYVFSQPDNQKRPVRMALRRISLSRIPGAPIIQPSPAKGVVPLPVKTFFDGQADPRWELFGLKGADFSIHGKFSDNRLNIDIPADKYRWGKAGLMSQEPVLVLNDRVQVSVYKVKLKVDPKETSGLELMFARSKIADMHQAARIAVSFVRHTTGLYAGEYLLSLSAGNNPYRRWSRGIDAQWVENNWDGRFEIEFGAGWVRASIPDGPQVRGLDFKVGKSSELFMTINSLPSEAGGGSKLVLERITGEWVMPDQMSKAERWNMVDDQEFDAEMFLDEMAQELLVNE